MVVKGIQLGAQWVLGWHLWGGGGQVGTDTRLLAGSAVAHVKGTAFPGSRGNGEADSGWLEVNWSSVMAHPAGAALTRL